MRLRHTIRKTRHHVRMWFGAAKRLHGALAFPHSQGPERATSVDKESSAEEPRCAPDWALSKKGLPLGMPEHTSQSEREDKENLDTGGLTLFLDVCR